MQPRGLAPLSVLLDSLALLPFSFTKNQVYQVWEYHGDTTLFAAITQSRDSAIPLLIDMLDRPGLANATADGVRVPVGVMYYQALTRMAYYEWDCDADPRQVLCAGWIRPNASEAELASAKLAWKEALKRGLLFQTK